MARVKYNKNTVQGYKRGHAARTRRYIKDTGKRYNARAAQLHKGYRYKCEQGQVGTWPVRTRRSTVQAERSTVRKSYQHKYQHGRVCSAPVIPKRTAQGVGQTRHICPRLADQYEYEPGQVIHCLG